MPCFLAVSPVEPRSPQLDEFVGGGARGLAVQFVDGTADRGDPMLEVQLFDLQPGPGARMARKQVMEPAQGIQPDALLDTCKRGKIGLAG